MRLGNAIIVPKISPRFVKLQICRCRKKLINSTDSREQYGLLMKGSILKNVTTGEKLSYYICQG
jgi:hypothetical protein